MHVDIIKFYKYRVTTDNSLNYASFTALVNMDNVFSEIY